MPNMHLQLVLLCVVICSEHCLKDSVTLQNLLQSNQKDLIVTAHLNVLPKIVSIQINCCSTITTST